MTTVIGSGISTKLNSFMAGKEAAFNAYHQFGRNNPDIIITFISTIFDQQETIKGIRSIIKDEPLVGCSSPATISAYGSYRHSVAVFILGSNSIKFSCGIGHQISKGPRTAGHIAASKASESVDTTRQAYIIFSDSLSGNCADILRGAQEVLGTSFPIIGGGACDELSFQKTYQYMDNNIWTDSVIGLLISGDITIGLGKASGWQPIGKPHKVTRANSNIIKQIDRKAAIEIYEDYFEKGFDELRKEGIAKLGINYPLGIQTNNDNRDYLTRVPLKIEDNGSLVMNGEIPEGEDISLMVGDEDMVLESAKNAAVEALTYIKNRAIKFAIIFSDIGRLLLLRKDMQKEIDVVKKALGKHIPILGCYTCGEYAHGSKGQFHFNNQIISIAVFSE